MDLAQIMAALSSGARQVLDPVLAFGPSLVAAVGLALAGWVLGSLLARWTVRIVDRLAPRLEQRATRMVVAPLGIERRLAEVVGSAVFWVVLVVFLAAATESLGLSVLATWIARAGDLLPRLLLGGLLVLAGLLVGVLARDAVTTAATAAGLAQAGWLGRLVQVVIVTAAVVTGMDHVGIDSQFVTAMLTVTVGGLLGGTALAFAFGARTEVSNMVAMHYVRQSFRPGQTVKLAGVTGQIKEFTTTGAVLDTATSRVRVPGCIFSDHIVEVATADE